MLQIAGDMFAQVGPVVICVVLGIVALTMFFKLLSRFESRTPRVGVVAIKGVLEGDSKVNVFLQDGEVLQRVRIRQLDFKNYSTTFSFHSMLVFELEQGGFTMVREDRISRIDFPDSKDIVMSIDQGQDIETMLSAD